MGLKRSVAHAYLRVSERIRPPRQAFIVGGILEHLDLDCVIDVGANRGQYARRLRRVGFTGRILSCEPIGDAFRDLAAASADDPSWTALQVALGAEEGEASMHVSQNSVSSSFLPMATPHLDLAPTSAYTHDETVRMSTVASLVDEHAVAPGRTLLKADVQGYESAVLDGAGASLGDFAALQLETSLLELYEDQPLFPELLARLTAEGFVLWNLFPGWIDRPSGRIWWGDGLFVRSDLVDRVPSRRR